MKLMKSEVDFSTGVFMLRKIITVTLEYADFGGEENFITTEDVLAETFQECDAKLARHLQGRPYKIKSYIWKKCVIDDPIDPHGDLPIKRTSESLTNRLS